jgi:3'-5' exonuclease
MGFAIFDIETRIDKQLLKRVFYAHDTLSDDEAYLRFHDDLRNRGSDFFPLTLHIPISIAIGDVSDDHVFRSLQTLTISDYSEESLVREFWRRLDGFAGCLVSFNGRRFDLPVLELAALRWGISAPRYFDDDHSPRSHLSLDRHLDLYEYLTNFGDVSLRGGMDLLLKMLGLPGKLTMNGAMVQEYFDAGRLEEIHRYCRTDVIQTYFLFLRVELMRGHIDQATYQAAWSAAAPLLEELRTEAENGGGVA